MSRVRWTEEKLREISSKFNSRTELAKAHRGAYRFAMGVPGLLDSLYESKRFVWTERSITAEASRYQSKQAFRVGSAGAYATCHSRFPGLIDQLFSNKIQYWRVETDVVVEAMKYSTRREFKTMCSGAYKSALSKFPHILDSVFGEPLVRRWTLDALIAEAQKYKSRQAFRAGSGGAHAAFNAFPGELDKVFSPKYRYWGKEADIREEASKYRTKAEFISGCISAYGAALNKGIIDDLGFVPAGPGFDTTKPAHLYVSDISLLDGSGGCMFGITNRQPSQRYTAAEKSVMSNKVSFLFDIGATALHLETMLRRAFIRCAALAGQSPLLSKLGTAGEILAGVCSETVLLLLQAQHPDLPEPKRW